MICPECLTDFPVIVHLSPLSRVDHYGICRDCHKRWVWLYPWGYETKFEDEYLRLAPKVRKVGDIYEVARAKGGFLLVLEVSTDDFIESRGLMGVKCFSYEHMRTLCTPTAHSDYRHLSPQQRREGGDLWEIPQRPWTQRRR